MKFSSIHSEELSLKVITAADVQENYIRWLNDSEINKFLQVRLEKVDLESQKEYVTRIYNSENTCLFGIYVQEKLMIGTIKIGPIDFEKRSGEIGLMIGERRYWSKGFATKSICMLCDAFFREEILTKITAGVSEQNIGSRKAFEKNGFSIESVLETQDGGADSGIQKIIRYGKTSG